MILVEDGVHIRPAQCTIIDRQCLSWVTIDLLGPDARMSEMPPIAVEIEAAQRTGNAWQRDLAYDSLPFFDMKGPLRKPIVLTAAQRNALSANPA